MTRRAALVANFDCERAWVGGAPLPTRVAKRLRRLGPLLAGLVPPGMPWRVVDLGVAEVAASAEEDLVPWGALGQPLLPVPSPLDLVSARAANAPSIAPMPADATSVWQLLCDHQPTIAAAVAASDRRIVARLAEALSEPFAGVVPIDDMAGLMTALAAHGGTCVLKPSLTAAGRDRVVLHHRSDTRTFDVARGLLRDRPRCILEPWVARTRDLGQVGLLTRAGELLAFAPHELVTTGDGTFVGARIYPATSPWLPPPWQARLQAALVAAAGYLHQVGYCGPFGIDAFAYQTPQGEALRALCEINPRLTFGWLAQAWSRRLGTPGLLTLRRLEAAAMATAAPLTEPPVAWFVPATALA